MLKDVDREQLRRLVNEGAQLLDVLPAEEYEEEHLPGAISIPLREIDEETATKRLEKGRPVVVYCFDYQ